jgi:hypothetical protein
MAYTKVGAWYVYIWDSAVWAAEGPAMIARYVNSRVVFALELIQNIQRTTGSVKTDARHTLGKTDRILD